MTCYRLLLTAVLTFFACLLSSGQKMPFINYTIENGLPQSMVYSLYQDSRGFLWAGTQGGVCRFDGIQFQVYDYQLGLVDNHVTGITESPGGTIWFGHRSGALSYLRNNRIHTFTHAQFRNTGYIKQLFWRNNSLWLATSGNGLLRITINAADTVIAHFTVKQGLNTDSINNVFAFADNAFYLATRQGIAILDPQTGSCSSLPGSVSAPGGNVTVIHRTGDGTFWCGTDSGLVTFNPATRACSKYTVPDGLCSNEINDIAEDREGYLWVATNKGVARFRNGLFNCYTKEKGLLSDVVYNVLADRDGVVWLSQYDGLSYYKDARFMLYTEADGLVYNEVYSIIEYDPYTYWIGTSKGISVYSANSNPGHAFKNITTLQGLPDNHVSALFKDSRGNIWIATGNGAACYLAATRQFMYLNKSGGLKGKDILSINEDRRGRIWLASKDNGVAVYDHTTKSATTYNTGNGFYSNWVWTIHKDRNGTLWFGTNDAGLVQLDEATDRFRQVAGQEQLHVKSFGSLSSDRQGNIWIASTGGGIYKYDGMRFAHYGLQQGLKLNNPYFIYCDQQENIWLGTSTGIAVYNPALQKTTSYGKKDGFIGIETKQNAILQDSRNDIWIGTVNGLVRSSPARHEPPLPPRSVHITRERLFLKDTILPEGAVLEYDRNHITFDYIGISLSNMEKVRYRYFLEGFDNKWSPPASDSYVTYTNLPPGSYTFMVQAGYADGSWSQQPAALSFVIRHPYWNTWWFMLLAMGLASCVIFILIKRREKSIRAIEAQKTEMEKLKTFSYQYQLEIEQVNNYFAASLSEKKNPDDILWDIVQNCISKLGFEDCIIYLRDEQRDVLVQKAAWGPKSVYRNEIVNPIEIPVGKGIVGYVARTGRAEIVADTAADSRYIVDDTHRQSEITVPMIDNGRVIGVIDSEHSQKGFYTERHLQILTTIALQGTDRINKVKAEQEMRQKEIELITLNRDLAISQLNTLRAQMNPHFIFNSLNSIQYFIAMNNTHSAMSYLSKFARLVRQILDNSVFERVKLSDELAMLDNYIALEQLRLEESFDYKCTVDPNLFPENIEFPSMLIQPYVENAILHGLRHLTTRRGKLLICVCKIKEGISCIIEDNGIGRAGSAQLTSASHKSAATTLSQLRFDKLSLTKLYKGTHVKSIDLYDNMNSPCGTRVIITIPVTEDIGGE